MWQVDVTGRNNIEYKNISLGKDRLLTKMGNEVYHNASDNSYQRINQYYNHANHIGSVNVISDYQGKEFKYVEYTPYGEEWFSETSNLNSGAVGPDGLEYGFTDHLHDEETGLIYANARYLDPKTSRWMSSDPAMGDYLSTSEDAPAGGVFTPLNLQTYHYAGNNPIKYVDPTGEWTFRVGITGSAGAGNGVTGGAGVVFGRSEEKGWQVGVYVTGGGGSAVGISASAGIEGGYAGGDNVNISDLDGASMSVGGSAVVVGLDVSTSLDGSGIMEVSGNASIGVGTPVEGHANLTVTKTASMSTTDLKNKVNEVKTQVVDKANEVKSQVMDKANEVKSQVMDKANEVKSKAVDTYQRFKEEVKNTADAIRQDNEQKYMET
ncbi:RHS repeat-associated core domain-containing protein [Entomospira entomophila]|uniref:Teneurin-like YD-shell domain-containing protein n=1 Tax=Entomospira entomophila TaxID=2719988 RepID=A0A968GCD7_9SPIO|nr:RHS repeat-associated core domain-containing protein [Entomospira entomophilus]NIZ41033.1 hypothetical protein [Entomospira entomophilus]WDI35246.1 RHS repeat-associated core domain-containing protein [Entomospira entomophilus]